MAPVPASSFSRHQTSLLSWHKATIPLLGLIAFALLPLSANCQKTSSQKDNDRLNKAHAEGQVQTMGALRPVTKTRFPKPATDAALKNAIASLIKDMWNDQTKHSSDTTMQAEFLSSDSVTQVRSEPHGRGFDVKTPKECVRLAMSFANQKDYVTAFRWLLVGSCDIENGNKVFTSKPAYAISVLYQYIDKNPGLRLDDAIPGIATQDPRLAPLKNVNFPSKFP
jgi:hypothetical protein